MDATLTMSCAPIYRRIARYLTHVVKENMEYAHYCSTLYSTEYVCGGRAQYVSCNLQCPSREGGFENQEGNLLSRIPSQSKK
jgi:hypothetical protein